MKFSMKNIIVAVAAAVSLGIISGPAGLAATTNVFVGFNGALRFSPTNVTVSVNDSVIWTWTGNHHSSTSGTNGVPGDDNGAPGGSWDSGITNEPFSFTNTFTTAGTYSYYCTVHESVGMTGQVFVVSSALPPTLTNVFELSGGTNFQFSYSANIGLNYVVLRSPDLFTWVPLATNVAESNPVVFTDLTATNSLNFYRVGLLPNP
jgi:plastocyanin